MEVKIQSIHFDATEKLQAFIEKKIKKFEKQGDEIRKVEVSLKVVKPETAMNKEAAVRLYTVSGDIFAEKVCDTFEEAVDQCIDAVNKQHTKLKEKQRNK
ncbi:MAG: ribosome-associated translation inhibitor RaiA [Bacteroidaceae bacterium]|jgi:putative sigma-54 modulation protein|nr:ribosome-associated translation inhibitor RaiA [Bacteroidaceae bacterium]